MLRFFLILPIFLIGCAHHGGINLGQYPDPTAAPDNFIHCHGYGCSNQVRIGFNESEWNSIKKIFKKESVDSKTEREKISQAIALMERYAGDLAGVENDLPKAPIIRKSNKELDCIDETINTTKYLGFLQKDGLLKWHELAPPAYKGVFVNGVYPHNTATIREIKTNQVYVIDSYIFANGEKPNIRPLENWQKYRFEEFQKAENAQRAAFDNIKY